ncbi:MAG: RagB/SusD family nutrient uptake outer membrane protein [Barnesiella sp.]|nr:RagB/SusD family nutrient uptake outer membrane protein [Barnesiella sp.]
MKPKYLSLIAGMACAGLAVGLSSCSDDLNLSNPNNYDAGNFWQTEANFTGNITAMMNQWRSTLDVFTMQNAGELRTDYYWAGGSLDGTALRELQVINNQYDEANPQFTNYANIYGIISNCNTFLYYCDLRGEEALPTDCREYLLGMVYGMRAYCNFQIHKVWGTGPIRDDAEVIQGNYDEIALRKPQATPEEFLENIKKDINLSLQHFAAGASYNNTDFKANGGQIYWSKAATEMLAGEVYLWSGKVSTGNHTANPTDVATAKTYFQNVANNYGYRLMPNYLDAVNVNGASNTERIFGTYYSQTEATNNWFNYIMYDPVVGGTIGNYWQCVEDDGITPATTGSRCTYAYNPGENNISVFGNRTTFFMQRMNGQNQKQSRNAFYYQFDPKDTRTAIFMPIYMTTDEEVENNIRNYEVFDFDAHHLAGCFISKYRGELNTGTNTMVGSNYMTYYRLALVYTYLAEIANYEGNNGDVEHYINLIRERAYGDNWNEATYGYKAGSFADNEIAILQEKTKEFFQEGQRWWDLRRLTIVKGGTEADHLVFRPEGCIGYGLDLASHPDWYEVRNNGWEPEQWPVIETNTPVLDYATQAHMVLWPLNQALLAADPDLKQTPGYKTTTENGNW